MRFRGVLFGGIFTAGFLPPNKRSAHCFAAFCILTFRTWETYF